MICDDCNRKEATTIIFDRNKGLWFRVCDDCIDTDNDIICPWFCED